MKNIIDKVKAFIIIYYQKFISKPSEITINNKLESLAPRILSEDKVKTYNEALIESIKNPDIYNIALTGSYGSGKSSILKTFYNKYHTEYDILSISLASFIKEKSKKKKDKEKSRISAKEVHKLVEVSILQQIFYHVSPKAIPNSRFKRIINVKKWQLRVLALGLTLWTISLFIIHNYSYYSYYNPNSWSFEKSLNFSATVLGTVTLLGLAYLTTQLVIFLVNSTISKIKFRGIELGKKSKDSAMNMHFDEVLYFFERNSYDLVIIEDLDRFENNIEIFTKFREINYLLNNSEQVKRPIKFIYAIKDEIFKVADRTKFFDILIPVIPIINLSNSKDKLRGSLENIEPEFQPSIEFIEEVSYFITDMRLVFNIYNEFFIYNEVLNKKPKEKEFELNPDKILAIIIYKNLKPGDFAKLHIGKGNLYELINSRNELIEILKSRCRTNINNLQSQINKIKSESLKNKKELRTLYVNAFMLMYIQRATGIDIDGSSKTFEEIIEKEVLFERLLEGIIKFKSQGYSINGVKFEELEKKVDSEMNYRERKNLIENSADGTIEDLKTKIERENNRILEYSSMSIGELLSEYELIKVEKKLELIENADELTLYLLRNSYIDIYYPFYISYYHGKSDKAEDREFILSNLNEQSKEFNFKIIEKKKIVEVLTPKFFSKKAILNIHVVDFLIEYRRIYKNKFAIFINQLANEEESSKSFIDFYISNGKKPEVLIQELASKWENLWISILNSEFSEDRIIKYFKLIIENVDRKNVQLLNKNNHLTDFINNQKFILKYFEKISDKKKVREILKDLDIKFNHLELIENDEISEYILNNSHYLINYENIEKALIYLVGVNSEEVNNSNYSIIKEFSHSPLVKYTEEYIEEYVEKVFLKSEAKEEIPKHVANLLNNHQLSNELKSTIIQEKPIKIDDLSLIEDLKIKTELIKHQKIAINWKNLLEYFKASENSISNEFIEFINDPSIFNELSKHQLKVDKESDEIEKELAKAIIYSDKIKFDAFKQLMEAIPKNWSNLELEKVGESELKFLVKNGFIALSIDDFQFLLENNSPLHLELVIAKFNIFKNNFRNYDISDWDFGYLLNSDNLSQEEKIDLLFLYNTENLIETESLSEKSCELIAASNKKVSDELLDKIFQNCSSVETRIKIFNNNVSKIDITQAKLLIRELPEEFQKLLQPRKRVKFDYSDTLALFFENLKFLGILTSAKSENGKIKGVVDVKIQD